MPPSSVFVQIHQIPNARELQVKLSCQSKRSKGSTALLSPDGGTSHRQRPNVDQLQPRPSGSAQQKPARFQRLQVFGAGRAGCVSVSGDMQKWHMNMLETFLDSWSVSLKQTKSLRCPCNRPPPPTRSPETTPGSMSPALPGTAGSACPF